MPMIPVTPTTLWEVMQAVIPAGIPLLVSGPPGVGKTRQVEQGALALKYRVLWDHPVTKSQVDYGGFPDLFTDEHAKRVAQFIPIGIMCDLLTATEPTLLILEDVATALPSVVAALMHVIWERKIGKHRIPDCVRFAATTNRREDGAASNGMISPFINRCCSVELGVTTEDWLTWAAENGIHADVIAFLSAKPNALWEPPTRTMEAFATPRAWENVSRCLFEAPNISDAAALPLVAGLVGAEAAAGFCAVRRRARRLPNIRAILANPLQAPLPDDLDLQYLLVSGLVHEATVNDGDRILQIAGRLLISSEEHGAALLRLAGAKLDKAVIGTALWNALRGGRFGRTLEKIEGYLLARPR